MKSGKFALSKPRRFIDMEAYFSKQKKHAVEQTIGLTINIRMELDSMNSSYY
jgi:hypothetical protein